MIPLFKVFMPESVIEPLKKTLFSGFIGQGPRVEEFEQALADYIGNPLILTINNGTAALHLALRLAGVGYGDEVITTALTCTATNWPILANGGIPVWADIDPDTGNIDPKSIAKRITKKTKAIMVVDWGGYPCDLEEIKKIAISPSGKKIPIIEDAAHAFGAIYENTKVGNIADFTMFSFQAIKHLTTVDGGALCLLDEEIYKRGKLLRWYGIDREGPRKDFRCEEDVKEWGYKFHMNDVTATIGLEQLKYVEKTLRRHRENAAYYHKNLKGIPGLTLLKEKPDRLSSYWIFTFKVKDRDKFVKYMYAKNITVSRVHRRNDTHPVVKQFKSHLPNLDRFEKEMICIPVGWWVTEKQRDYIVKSIKAGWV